MEEESQAVMAFFFSCAVFTRGARHGKLKNSLETQKVFAKTGALQSRFCIMTRNNAKSVRAGIDKFVSWSSESMQIFF